jgi:peptidoglycan/LPS O-acetylase OafA/YrhL
MNRIPALDGLRGLAIALVLFDHLQDSLLSRHLNRSLETGYHGVVLFFVLSGFLITSKLVEGSISFRRFFLRRFFRLVPAAWTYLAFLVLAGMLTGKQFTSRAEVIACVFSYRNFLGEMGFAGHFWSLSIEEQFYLLWPLTLFLAGTVRARWIAVLGAIACAILRYATWSRYGPHFPTGPTFLHADWLLMGCFAALLIHDPRIRKLLSHLSGPWAVLALCVFAFCMFSQSQPVAESVSVAALLVSATLQPTSICARVFSLRPVRWLGQVSYSFYLWQEFFVLQHRIWALAVMPIFALGSYYLIERPFTQLGHRLTARTVQQDVGDRVSATEPVAD